MHRAIGILEHTIFRRDRRKVEPPQTLVANLHEAIDLWRSEGLSDADARAFIVGEFENMRDIKEPATETTPA